MWQRDLSVSLDRIGRVLRAQGKLDGAIDYAERDLSIAQRLAESDPTNAEWQVDLAISLVNVAAMKPEGADALRQEAVSILETLDQGGQLAPRYRGFLDALRDDV